MAQHTFVPDPAIGVWKLNVDKSSFAIASAPQSSIMNVQAWEDGLKVGTDTIDEQGNKLHLQAAYKFDGNDYPLIGSPVADTISSTRITQWKTESVWRKNGKIAMTTRTIVSSDGTSVRVIRTGVGSLGRMADEFLVYERQ